MSLTFDTSFVDTWWSRVRAGEKIVQKCNSCGHLQMHPRRLCNECAASDLGFALITGRGKIYSFSTIYHNAPSEFLGQVPYTLAIVRLEEGPQMLSQLVECSPEEIGCDVAVEWRLAEINGKTMPCFELLRSS